MRYKKFNPKDYLTLEDNTPDLTPVVSTGGIWVKRDDTFRIAGISGGKVRACWHLITTGIARRGFAPVAGVITASSRQSPQAQIVARLAQRLGLPARLHMPTGPDTPEMVDVKAHGGEIVQHRPGYNTVIVSRAKEDHAELGDAWIHIPFGMESRHAMACTRAQVATIQPHLPHIDRIVVPVGSGMTLAGILWGLYDLGKLQEVPVVGITVGADPRRRLNTYAPPMWHMNVRLREATTDYHTHVFANIGKVILDPVYEAKCREFLLPNDLFWIVGKRAV